jgi:hypothetical protein
VCRDVGGAPAREYHPFAPCWIQRAMIQFLSLLPMGRRPWHVRSETRDHLR